MRGRLTLIAVSALALASVDLVVKAALPTSPWLVHERSGAWIALSVALLAACGALARVPSRFVASAAGCVAGGLLGNLVSAVAHDGAVPNPLLIGGARHGLVFNLADLFFVAGLAGLIVAAARAATRPSDSRGRSASLGAERHFR